MASFETDYLIIGAGATGLSFADTLLKESDAHITIVDKHAQPGGHWNDAYPFVALHQPSAFYGVNSLELGSRRKDTVGHNAGLYELASGAEVTGYFHKVMHQSLLPSGRVRYLPMSNYSGIQEAQASVQSILSGQESQITVRKKLVDATYFTPQVPATTPPKFKVADGVRLVTPTQLTQIWQSVDRPKNFCILGAGKTAMDAAVWLLTCGASPESIHWVMPRDSWLINRITTQPGIEFFEHSIGGVAKQMKAIAEATSIDDLFERLEASGQMLRIDPTHTPRMFHYATMSEGEVQLLRQIKQFIRKGRVQVIERDALVLAEGRESMPANTLYINCTASGVEPRPSEPMFQPGRIVPQLLRAPLVTFSAAVCAYVEVHYDDDALKNKICAVVPFPRDLSGYVTASIANMVNQVSWSQNKKLRQWMTDSRLDGFSKMTASIEEDEHDKIAILMDLRANGMAAMDNVKKLMASA
ncbi:FAD/NAD(P)-binding protein [Variovorax sp. PCZ-1]|uniref:NAD(P)-binding protein n=1 Tax=Variovorax sp. PCZ-1 TaxID=2835533 RepID=UPI001BCF63EE|nr:FAD/NAD(P)-binding protein [Variovorax sp. PCZ-1]MBS7808531.1 NAD(P)/FAD-dependent oxidoreductase [Variovorax sp. PCZ-1]